MELKPGDPFDRYTIEELLGEGGMGRVYRAYDPRLARRVALKLVIPHQEADRTRDSVTRLMREARAAAALEHANAVAVYDVGEVDGAPFIAMEFIEGRSLRAFIGDPSVPVDRRVRWLLDAARALAAAHQRGLVHRDVKPENVMVRADGAVKVLDFGIARRVESVDAAGPPEPDAATLTQKGTILGTPAYMAPEQVRGDALDGRSDQFAWGVLAYELLSGRLPWSKTGEFMRTVAEVLTGRARPVREIAPEVPPAVEAVVMRALGKEPQLRFTSMEEVVSALEPYASYSTGDVNLAARRSGPVASHPSTISTLVRAPLLRRLPPGSARALGAVLAVVVIGLPVAVALSRRGGVSVSSAPPLAPTASSEASGRPVVITDLPVPAADPRAQTAYRAGLQAMRDAALDSAIERFEEALAADPSLVAAHVQILMMRFSSTEVMNRHLRAALGLRAQLPARDLEVLEALEPELRAPMDLAEAERRIGRLVDRYPLDAQIQWMSAETFAEAGHPDRAVAVVDRALELDPGFAAAHWAKAMLMTYGGGPEAAVSAELDRCLSIAPNATSCLRMRARMETSRGDCAELERDARQWVTHEPSAVVAYDNLASALLGQGAHPDALREALRQKWLHVSDADRARTEAFDRLRLATALGDFAQAEVEGRAVEAVLAETSNMGPHALLARERVGIFTESGRPERALAVADEFVRKKGGLVPETHGTLHDLLEDDPTPLFAAVLRRAGRLTEADSARLLDGWLSAMTALAGNEGSESPQIWVIGYARPAETKDEALAALAREGKFGQAHFDVDFEADVGKVHALAGQPDAAAPHLARAAQACQSFTHPFAYVRANELLGEVREGAGDRDAACRAYAAVLARWGSAKPSSVTAARAQKRSRALGCPL